MKSAQFTGIRQIEIRDLPAPRLTGENDVLLRIKAVGVCGSDVHYFVDGRIGDQILEYPITPGHEFSAVVEQVGAAVSRLRPGDRVAVEPAISCGSCDQCLSGRQNTCRNVKFVGAPNQWPGASSEFLVMPERNCFKIPDSMSFAQGAFAEPLSIAIYGLTYLASRAPRTAVILGAGPIGLSVLLEAKQQHIPKVFVSEKLDYRIEAAKNAGATWTGNPDKADIVSELLEQEPLGFDAVMECCGQQEAIDQAIELLKPGGALLIYGIPAQSRISFDINAVRRKEITIQPIRRQNECLEPAIDRIASGQINIDSLITHTGGLQDSQKLYDLAANYADGVIKAVVEM